MLLPPPSHPTSVSSHLSRRLIFYAMLLPSSKQPSSSSSCLDTKKLYLVLSTYLLDVSHVLTILYVYYVHRASEEDCQSDCQSSMAGRQAWRSIFIFLLSRITSIASYTFVQCNMYIRRTVSYHWNQIS